MDKEALENLEAKETAKITRIVKTIDSNQLSMKEFYPEFDLESPYGSSLEPREPVWAVLPYYKHTIVSLGPMENEKRLKAAYGLEVHQLLELSKEKKIYVRLTSSPTRYVGLDYLDPVLEKEPPAGNLRTRGFNSSLAGEDNLEKFRISGEAIFRGKFKAKPQDKLQHPEEQFYKEWQVRQENIAIGAYAHLRTMGYDEIVRYIERLANSDANAAAYELDLYRLVLLGPTFYSLDGAHFLHSAVADEAYQRIKTFLPKGSEVFPAEVGKCLTTHLKLVRPKGLDHSLEVYPDFEKARRALSEFDETINARMALDEISSRIKVVEDTWNETALAMSRMDRVVQVSKLAYGLGLSAALGVVGSLAGNLPASFGGLLGTLGYIITSERIAQPLSERVAKLRRPSAISIVWDINRKWSQR